nr:hypothetical protein [uncultured Clostridium sp.]
MSEVITSDNLDDVIKKNTLIENEINSLKDSFYTTWNLSDGIKAEEKLAIKILKDRGLIQIPINDEYWGGAIFVNKNKKVPVINTAQPRVYQYFVAWHEVYHLINNFKISNKPYNITIDMKLNERKADYFAAKMMLGNVYNYFTSLKEESFINKIMYCMDLYKAPYKAILINLYEEAIKTNNNELREKIIENFDKKPDLIEKFKQLELDDELVKPSNLISVNNIQRKIQKAIDEDGEATYHRENMEFLNKLTRSIEQLIKE